MSPKTKKKVAGVIWYTIGIVCFLVMMFPLFWMLSCSLREETYIFSTPPHLLPPKFTIAAYIKQLQTEQFPVLPSLKNSMIIALATTVIAGVFGTLASYGLARFRIKGAGIIIMLFLISQMLPQTFSLIPCFVIFKNIGVFNTYWAPILGCCTAAIPFSVIMLRSYFMSIPKEVDDAALIDGCNHLQSFVRIMVPIVSSGIVVALVFAFLQGYGDMMYSLTYVADSTKRPITTGIYNVVGRYGLEWNRAMAFGFMAVLPVIIVFLLMEKYIVEGLAAGAVKG